MSNQKRICQQCDRILQLSVHDKCLFCGAPIPEIFKLNDIEKQKIHIEAEAREKKRIKHKKTSSESGGGTCGSGVCGGA